MAGISQDDIQKVREASDIVAVVGERVPLKQRGVEFWGCCPFHNEKTPSFKVDSSTQLWHCFGCGEGGDIFSFLMKRDNLNFPEAVRYLADKAHIDIADGGNMGVGQGKKQRLKEICKATADFYHAQLMRSTDSNAQNARNYLSGRGLGGDIPKLWNLGFSPGRNRLFHHLSSLGFTPSEMVEANVVVGSNSKLRDRFYERVMFPINDISGECIAFGGRIMGDGQPKYLNSQETPIFHKSNVLFGLDKAKGSMASSGVAIVAEGYTDVIALHKAGIKNAVATLGTSLTKNHIRLLSRHANKKIIYLFDGDEAGQRATERALQFIDVTATPEAGRSQVEIYALSLPDNMDPAEYLDAYGAEEMRRRLDAAEPLIMFGIKRRIAKYDLRSAESRYRALGDTLQILAPIKNSILAKEYAIQIAGMLHLKEQDVLDELLKLKEPPAYEGQNDQTARKDAEASNRSDYGAAGVSPLSNSERNRRSLEREFLSLMAQNPMDAIRFADILSKTMWHEDAHAKIADSMVATLTDDLSSPPAKIIENASLVVPDAANILTSARKREGVKDSDVLEVLSKELTIGDKEDRILSLKNELAHTENMTKEKNDELFKKLISLQKEVTEERASIKHISV